MFKGIIPEEDTQYFSKSILQALTAIQSLTCENQTAKKVSFIEKSVKNSSDIIKAFQKDFDITDADNRKIRRAPILAAVLNAFALGQINTSDIKHISSVLMYPYGKDITYCDESLIKLAQINNETKGSGCTIVNNLFALTSKAIINYKKGNKGNIRKPNSSTTLELPQIYNFEEKNYAGIVQYKSSKIVKKVASSVR